MLWVCGGCTARYAPGLAACPNCGSSDYRPDYEEDGAMSSKATYEGVSFDPGKEPPGYRSDAAPAGAAAAAPELPADRAPKAEWVDHAVTVAGLEPEQAESMTKTELQETVKAAVPGNPPPAPPGA